MRTATLLRASFVGIFPLAVVSWNATAWAQSTAPSESGQAPADVAQAVTAPKAADAPAPVAAPTDSTTAAVSAGGQYAAGNSKLAAFTGLGKFEMRRGNDGFGASLLGNFAESFVTPAAPANAAPGTPAPSGSWKTSTQNLQGRLRYDRYFTPDFGAFLQLTGTHDAFQALSFRLNVDPGVKLYFYDQPETKFWGELGYDFEFDDNDVDSNGIEQAGSGGPALDANSLPYVIKSTDTVHSSRLFAGFKHSFNKEVSLSVGLEYLQGIGGTGTGTPAVPNGYMASGVDRVATSVTAARLNGDALLAAAIGAGFSVGIGLAAKYTSAPLAGKQNVDTSGTFSLIYAFAAPAPKPAH